MFGIFLALLALAGGLLYRRRLSLLRELRKPRITDDMIRNIEDHGQLRVEEEERLDHNEIAEEERRFWEESTWDEPEEL